ncbi:MAG: hypothetical protein KBA07_08005 [Petrotogaceae bacterium]|nr:hypothetical protein [Petrotogaceae bacterium]
MKKLLVLILLIIISFSSFAQSYGLTIAGGAAYVFKSMGFLQALVEEGFFPQEYYTTSMGGFPGYFMAAGIEPKSVYEVFKIIDFEEMFDLSFPLNGGFVNSQRLMDLVYAVSGVSNFSQFKYPLHLGVLNLNTWEDKYISEGDALKALAASTALEVFFEVVRYPDGSYSDIGPKDLMVKYPKDRFGTDKTFLMRITPNPRIVTSRDYSNIINIAYLLIDIGGFYANNLYSADKIDYDHIFNMDVSSEIDPKNFSKAIELYDIGYAEGKEWVKNNDIFSDYSIEKNNIEPKEIDYKKIYTDFKTESIYRPRDFYYTFKISPVLKENMMMRAFIYSEFGDIRLSAGEIVKYDLSLDTFINGKLYYFPFENSRISFDYIIDGSFRIDFKNYFLKEYKNLFSVNLGHYNKFSKLWYNFADFRYDTTVSNRLEENGCFFESRFSTDFEKLNYDFEAGSINQAGSATFYSNIGYAYGDDMGRVNPDTVFDSFDQKIYLNEKIKVSLMKDMNFDIAQFIYLNDAYVFLDYFLTADDFKKVNHTIKAGVELPFSFGGVFRIPVEMSVKYKDGFQFSLTLQTE